MSTMPPPPPPSSMPPGYQPYGATVGAPTSNLASWGARVGGAILNSLCGIVFSVPAIIAVYTVPREYTIWVTDGKNEIVHAPTATGWLIIWVAYAIGMIVHWVVYSRAVGKTGQFWGHRGAGVRIVDASTGAPIGTGRAFGRSLAHILDAIPCGLGFLWPLWDSKKQTFADKIVGTVVVRA